MDSKKLLNLTINFRKCAQEVSRTDPVMDLIDKYKDKLLQKAADTSAGKSVSSADIYLNYDGVSTLFVVEAMGKDAQTYNVEAAAALNKDFKMLLSQATMLLKKEKIAPIKFRILQNLEFSSR